MTGTKQARRAPADKYDERRNQLAHRTLHIGYTHEELLRVFQSSPDGSCAHTRRV